MALSRESFYVIIIVVSWSIIGYSFFFFFFLEHFLERDETNLEIGFFDQ